MIRLLACVALALPKVSMPADTMVVSDDPALDAERLVASLRSAKRDVTYHLSPDANHVLKHEPLSPEQLRADMAAVQTGYSAEGRALDQDVVTALVAWLRAH